MTPGELAPLSACVRRIDHSQPLRWLKNGWQDMLATWTISVLHGVVLAVIGALFLLFGHDQFWLIAGAFSGFMIIAPVLATSFYALSRALSRGEAADWSALQRAWLNWRAQDTDSSPMSYWRMIIFGLCLALASTGWVLTSAALITVYAPAPVRAPIDFLEHIVLANEGMVFELWMTVGGFLAAPMFASSVVSMPLLLDRQIRIRQAILVSWYAVLLNPVPMAIWAMCILSMTLIGFATLMLGLVLIAPWLGHASWHAYQDLVDTDQIPALQAWPARPEC